jgi:DNA-binding phage protein
MPLKTRPFDPAEHLRTDEDIKYFLQDAAEGTPEEFLDALNTVG